MSTEPVLRVRLLTGFVLLAALGLAPACGGDEGSSSTTTSTAERDASSTSFDASTTTTTEAATLVEVVVVDGQPTGGARQVRIAVGEAVTLRVVADAPDEVHVHGYDLVDEVAPERPAEITFTADIPGQFEVELEGTGVVLVELTVT